MLLGYLTLLTALILSLSAAVYSILGLTAIFAAAFWPIVILGGSLEVGKIVTVLWLHKYWKQAEIQYKLYLCSAVIILMVLTSMGIFGYLSKAHLDQAVPSGDIQAQVQIFDDKIQTQKDNIKAARAALTQMDSAVDQTMGRTTDEKGADKAATLRRSQGRERTALQNDISKSQTEIVKLQEARGPIASQARKVEAEVGPIKYIAALVYGDNPDANILEKAVRWVIILIVVVFDPLALTLLLAATKAFEWERGVDLFNGKKKDEDDEEEEEFFDHAREVAQDLDSGTYVAPVYPPMGPITSYTYTSYEPDDGPLTDDQLEQIRETANKDLPTGEIINKEELFPEPKNKRFESIGWMFNPLKKNKNDLYNPDALSAYNDDRLVSIFDKEFLSNDHTELPKRTEETDPNYKDPAIVTDFETQDPETAIGTKIETLPAYDQDDDYEDESKLSIAEKQARRIWKEENHMDTVKHQRRLLESGFIDVLPWNRPEFRERTNTVDGNLWLQQDGEWVNAGPMGQFDFSGLGLDADNAPAGTTGEMRGFGTSFPETAAKGDMFLRVDRLPSMLYKFNGNLWIEVDKALSDQHTYDEAYIDHLIEKISTGEYDPELLSNAERDSIERRLHNKTSI